MDRVKIEKLMTENMRTVFGFALTRLSNVGEAEILASDIIYEVLRSAPRLRDESRFFGFMWKIAENTYAEYLRKKSGRADKIIPLDENFADESPSPADEIVKREEMNLLRRELSLLSRQYREATVLYYIEGLSCMDVAKKLNISVEMVKYYLFRARKIIREGISMERLFGEKSYHPGSFEIAWYGTKMWHNSEWQDFKDRRIKGNILLVAYYVPVTIQEISVELGVSLPYLEDEITLLVQKKYLLCKNGRYLTNIPIFTPDCAKSIDGELNSLVKETAEKLISVQDGWEKDFGERCKSENLAHFQKLLLALHFSVMATDMALTNKYGEMPNDGPYSIVAGSDCRGIVWGKSEEALYADTSEKHIQGIYNENPESGQDSVIAMNFYQTLNAQHFAGHMREAVISVAKGELDGVPDELKEWLERRGYTKEGRASFRVYTIEEYRRIANELHESVDVISELICKAAFVAAGITGDLAPEHIRGAAEYTGAFVYRFAVVERLVDDLFDMKWLKPVCDKEKPALCVVIK